MSCEYHRMKETGLCAECRTLKHRLMAPLYHTKAIPYHSQSLRSLGFVWTCSTRRSIIYSLLLLCSAYFTGPFLLIYSRVHIRMYLQTFPYKKVP